MSHRSILSSFIFNSDEGDSEKEFLEVFNYLKLENFIRQTENNPLNLNPDWNFQQLFVHINDGIIPNRFHIKEVDFKDIIEQNNRVIHYRNVIEEATHGCHSIIYQKWNLMIVLTGSNGKNGTISRFGEADVYFASNFHNEAKEFVKSLKKKKDEPTGIQFLGLEHGSFYIKRVKKGNVKELDFALYNDGFDEFDKNVLEWAANFDTTGLIMLSGAPGTGKTSYLRTLAHRTANLVYVPADLVSGIGSPDFIHFLVENPNNIFLVEDAENIAVSEGLGRSQALQSLLNATDGILGDIIKTKFILTFNASIEDIDKALVRPGRLSFHHEFKELNKKKADALLIKLGKQPKGQDMTLARIFNEEVLIKKEETRRVGF